MLPLVSQQLIATFIGNVNTLLVGFGMLLAEGEAAAEQQVNPIAAFAPLVIIGLLAYFMFAMPAQNRQRQFQAMLDGLKENDHIITTGGIHGVITSIQREQNRLTIRVDENSGAKMRVSMWAIDSVVSDEKNNTDQKS